MLTSYERVLCLQDLRICSHNEALRVSATGCNSGRYACNNNDVLYKDYNLIGNFSMVMGYSEVVAVTDSNSKI